MGGGGSHHHYHTDTESIKRAEDAQEAARVARAQAEETRRQLEEQRLANEKMFREQREAQQRAEQRAREEQERYQQRLEEAQRQRKAEAEQAARRLEEQRRQAAAAEERARQEQAAAARRLEEEQARRVAEAEAAARQLEEERLAAEEKVKQARQQERERVHAERLQRWEELNRQYPIPEYMQAFVTGVRDNLEEDAKEDRFVNVGILGNSGTGKSSLIRAILEHFHTEVEPGNKPRPTACFEGDGTCAPTPYMLASFGDKVRIWDLPGQGTAKFPAETYLRDMGLKYFDAVLVATSGRLLENDLHLLQAIKFAEIWVNVVRTKVDLAVEDGKVDHDPPLAQEEVLKRIQETLARQLGESELGAKTIHLVTVRKQYWIGAHGGMKFGTIDELCEQVAERVESGQTWQVVGGPHQA